jgi:hypothetical protein
MTEASGIRVRPATRDDAAAITRIYNEGIRGRARRSKRANAP